MRTKNYGLDLDVIIEDNFKCCDCGEAPCSNQGTKEFKLLMTRDGRKIEIDV